MNQYVRLIHAKSRKKYILTIFLESHTADYYPSSPKGKSKVAIRVYYVFTLFDIANRAVFLV